MTTVLIVNGGSDQLSEKLRVSISLTSYKSGLMGLYIESSLRLQKLKNPHVQSTK